MAGAAKPMHAVAEEGWFPARIIPTSGIGGQDEQERRATSALLAVMRAVPDFGRALLSHLDAPAGKITTFTEVQLRADDEKMWIPDGAIVVERGKTRWRCLVEVKTSGGPLRVDQVSSYLDMARLHGFQAVLTISNEITASPRESPVLIDGRRTRRVNLRHLSWWQVMTEAIVQQRHRGISDPDQAWILGELIAYLDNERSGAGGFDDMGERWVAVRDGARQQTLRANDAGVRDVAARWEQFVQYVCLGLQGDLGRDVTPAWPRNLDQAARLESRVRTLVDTGKLQAAIRVPDAVGPLELEADLRARLLTTAVEIAAPREGRPKTRVTWLLRQLREPPGNLRIEAWFPNIKEPVSQQLSAVHERPERVLLESDPKREPRAFRVALSREMGTKRGRIPGSFIHETRAQALGFYREVVQQLRPWAAGPPKLPQEPVAAPEVATPEPPAFSGEESREIGQGADPEDAAAAT
jgi:hypothetical protein